jgi:hypothetical protein
MTCSTGPSVPGNFFPINYYIDREAELNNRTMSKRWDILGIAAVAVELN